MSDNNIEQVKTLAERQDIDDEIVVLAEFTDQKKIKEEQNQLIANTMPQQQDDIADKTNSITPALPLIQAPLTNPENNQTMKLEPQKLPSSPLHPPINP